MNSYLSGIESVEIPEDSEPLLLYPEQILYVLTKYGEEVAAETRKAVLLEKEPVIAYERSRAQQYKVETKRLTGEVHGLQVGLGISIGVNVAQGGITLGLLFRK